MLRTKPIATLGLLTLLVITGCAGDDETEPYGDDGREAAQDMEGNDGDEELPGFCDDMEVEVNGRAIESMDSPRVGDKWRFRMFCQGVLMTGANLLKFTPPAIAVVDDDMTDATFVNSGSASVLLQSGNFQYRNDIHILPAL